MTKSPPPNEPVIRGDYSVSYQSGSNTTLVLAFAGIGNLLPDRTGRHFRGTLESICPDCHRLYIVDTARSWFNSQNGFVELLSEINQVIKDNAIQRIVSVGISMGGTGALLISHFFPIERIIAFSPLVDIVDSIEDRWTPLYSHLPSRPRGRIIDFVSRQCDVVVIAGSNNWLDVWQACQLQVLPSVKIYYPDNADHDTADYFKTRNQLDRLLQQLIFEGHSDLLSASWLSTEKPYLPMWAQSCYMGAKGNMEMKLLMLSAAITRCPVSHALHIEFAHLALRNGKLEEAKRSAHRIVAEQSLSGKLIADAHRILAHVAEREKNIDEKKKHAYAAFSINPHLISDKVIRETVNIGN